MKSQIWNNNNSNTEQNFRIHSSATVYKTSIRPHRSNNPFSIGVHAEKRQHVGVGVQFSLTWNQFSECWVLCKRTLQYDLTEFIKNMNSFTDVTVYALKNSRFFRYNVKNLMDNLPMFPPNSYNAIVSVEKFASCGIPLSPRSCFLSDNSEIQVKTKV